MKLYTEEQVHKAYDAGMQFIGEDKGSPIEFFSSLTPIELPTDEEILEESKIGGMDTSQGLCFQLGAKWVIDKIKGGTE
jgi:hypothetical protein